MKAGFLSRIFGCRANGALSDSERTLRRELLTTQDVTHTPPAFGFLRDVQLADVCLLREIMRVSVEAGLHPWLVGGGLFGVMRHGGRFMSWDDDIDLGIIREEYPRFLDVFNATCQKGFYAVYHYREKYCRIKVRHEELPPKVDLSVFVFDRFWKPIPTLEEKVAFRKKVDAIQCRLKKLSRTGISLEEHLRAFEEARTKELFEGHAPASAEEKPAVFWGPELKTFESVTSMVYDYDDIFPLRKARFEGVDVLVPNDSAAFLTYMYGDWGRFPEYFTCRHKASNFSVEKALALRRFVRTHIEAEAGDEK